MADVIDTGFFCCTSERGFLWERQPHTAHPIFLTQVDVTLLTQDRDVGDDTSSLPQNVLITSSNEADSPSMS